MALDFLNGTPGVTSGAAATQTTLPDWYNSYIQGIAGKATDIAATPYENYPGAQVADFNDDQQRAFQQVRDNVGNYQPALTAAGSAIGAAPGAVAGPAQSWTDPGAASKYMSPYISSVTDEIARLGNQNLTQNIIPQTQANFVGSGQFGSDRNAQVLGQNVRDTQTNISGLQSSALQSGYAGAEGQFNADANRTQLQGSLQAQTGLQAGTALGGLGSLTQQLGNNQASSLGAVGGQEQQLEQTADTTAYQNFLNQQNWDWTQLGKVQGAVQGAQLPTGSSTATNTQTTSAGTSPLAWVTALSGLYNATQTPGG